MSRQIFACVVFFPISCAAFLMGQQNSPSAASAGVPEFPVTLQQNVVAGKTAVGSKIQAKLTMATLVDGKVVPRNAVLYGEVTESAARSSSEPSRLSLRMDTLQWKNGSAPVKIYLTAWYYPTVQQSGQDVQYGPTQPANRTWNGEGQYPDPNSKIYRPFPGDESAKNSSPSNTPVSITSDHRVLMKDVESRDADNGTIILLSHRSNLKLDKYTTYVFASRDLLPAATK
jgi:hypothetical protein